MKYFLIPACLFTLMFVGCSSDDGGGQLQPTDPTISVSADLDITNPICLGNIVKFTIELRTFDLTGIESFIIRRNGSEDIVTQTSFTTADVNFAFDYQANNEDLENGEVTLDFILTDNNQRTVSESFVITVVTEFSWLVESISPKPSLDIVNNVSVNTTQGPDVDIYVYTETEDCGPGCINYRHTFVSRNDARIFDIATGGIVNLYTNQMKQVDVEAAIAGLMPIDSFVVYSNFNEDFDPNSGILTRFPIVVQIRNTNEYAVIDKAPENEAFSYRKRSELAGG